MPDFARLLFVKRHLRPRGYVSGPEDWQVCRFAQEDWVLNVRVQRIKDRRLEIALFLAEDHEKYVKDAGVMAGVICSLSDAYFRLGKMAIYFVGPPEGYERDVPESIRRVAHDHDVTL